MSQNKPNTKSLPTSKYDKNASPIPRQANVGITSLPGTDYPKNAKPIKAYKDNAQKAGDSKMFFTE